MIGVLNIQDAQTGIGADLSPSAMQAALSRGPGFAAVDGPELLGIGGAYEVWRGRAVAWALLSRAIGGPRMVGVHRAVERWLAVAPYPRIEIHTDVRHPAAGRWAGALGFEREGTMRKFFNGLDFDLYARTR